MVTIVLSIALAIAVVLFFLVYANNRTLSKQNRRLIAQIKTQEQDKKKGVCLPPRAPETELYGIKKTDLN